MVGGSFIYFHAEMPPRRDVFGLRVTGAAMPGRRLWGNPSSADGTSVTSPKDSGRVRKLMLALSFGPKFRTASHKNRGERSGLSPRTLGRRERDEPRPKWTKSGSLNHLKLIFTTPTSGLRPSRSSSRLMQSALGAAGATSQCNRPAFEQRVRERQPAWIDLEWPAAAGLQQPQRGPQQRRPSTTKASLMSPI